MKQGMVLSVVLFAVVWSASAATNAESLFGDARWIAQPQELNAAAPCFSTSFTVDRAGPAEIAVCGLGQYVATLNGKPIGRGDEFNLPGWTRTSKTCFYNVFRPVLKAGEVNTLKITLGNGMYNVPSPGPGLYTKFTGSEGGQKLLVGGVVKSSPDKWSVSVSEIVRTHVYSGDDIDRTADTSKSFPAVAAEAPKGILREAPFVCRLQEKKKPVRTMRVSNEELTVDFGQNAAYVPTVVANGPKGSSVVIEFSEIPLKEGETRITAKPGGYGNKMSRCAFTLAGTGADETFTPPFFYYGFRYLKARLIPAQEGGERPTLVSAEARVVMADTPRTGSFECSIPLFNKIHDICWWAQRSNMQSVFTDCPHREKLGWQEQTHIHAEQIRWGWNADAIFAKTCRDLADSQLPDGMCPDIAPEFTVFNGGFRHSIEWGSSMIQIPWQHYEWTGDDSLIREYYPNMVAYHRYIRSFSHNPNRGDFITPGGLGDWYQETAGGNRPIRKTTINFTATAFYYLNAATLAKCAEMLGKNAEAAEYRTEAENIKKAFNAKWWRPDIHGYENNSQTANAMAIAFGLSDPAETDAIVSNIVEDVRGRGNAVGTGEIGYPYLLKVLMENGHNDVIFEMTADSSKPGYGYMIEKGNTSCHEAWDARPSVSHNHFMMADIVNWFYGSLAGIRRTSPGFKTFTIAPAFLQGLDWVKASHTLPSGDIRVEWHRENASVRITVTVPPGTVATIRLPGQADVIQQPGERTYTGAFSEHRTSSTITLNEKEKHGN
ncbi:MAG: family 78 glycoside hydrolase catalytic domain [Kiritimatiellae bacterium]|nr:family 78 glycoside hydrolase catalytic domain [Kiritimatiellia bacterium]